MLFQTPPINLANQVIISITEKKEVKEELKLYTIRENDTLTSISAATGSSVERLWEKNTQLTSPDIIKPGDTLTIPKDDEALADRPLPVREVSVSIESVPTGQEIGLQRNTGGFSSSGNTYSVGYCTHFAKQMRPDLPNNLGNADTWGIRAAAQGFTVTNSPAVGSVGVAKNYMHVAIVTGIHDGMVDISEQNYKGWGIVSSRTAPISEFTYIL